MVRVPPRRAGRPRPAGGARRDARLRADLQPQPQQLAARPALHAVRPAVPPPPPPVPRRVRAACQLCATCIPAHALPGRKSHSRPEVPWCGHTSTYATPNAQPPRPPDAQRHVHALKPRPSACAAMPCTATPRSRRPHDNRPPPSLRPPTAFTSTAHRPDVRRPHAHRPPPTAHTCTVRRPPPTATYACIGPAPARAT